MSAMQQTIHALLKLLIDKGGQDLFITEGAPVSAKIDGVMTPLTPEKLNGATTKALALALMTPAQQEEFLREKELNFAYQLPGISRYRINAFTQRGFVGMVIRVINATIPDFRKLNLPQVLLDTIMEKRGLVLFVGGTGSGKSTSLAALIGYRNENSQGHIITIEDPVEFIHPHRGCIVTQREVGVDTESYEIALKNTLRQAPDVILIGEIRDHHTMEHAIAFAETGHLAVSTLHANNTNQALDRIINFFPEERKAQLLMDLSLNLKAIISQRLVPKEGGGRAAAVEVLLNTPRMSDLIFQGKVSEMKALIAKSREEGMQTFDQHLFELYESELISYENALRFADSVNDVRLNIKLNAKRKPPADKQEGVDLSIQKD